MDYRGGISCVLDVVLVKMEDRFYYEVYYEE